MTPERDWSGHMIHFNFWSSNDISGTAEAIYKVVKFRIQIGYVKWKDG